MAVFEISTIALYISFLDKFRYLKQALKIWLVNSLDQTELLRTSISISHEINIFSFAVGLCVQSASY